MPRTHKLQPRAERTRAAILKAAEEVFAQKGFAAARLVDVAERVGIRRASIVYYFRDKRALYDAVLDDVFGEILQRFETALAGTAPLAARMRAVTSTWVAYVGERPTVARFLLREAAEAAPARRRVMARHVRPAIAAVARAIREGQRQQVLGTVDPIHYIFTVVGATVFFVAGTPVLAPEWGFDPASRRQLDIFRTEMLDVTTQLLLAHDGHNQHRRLGSPRRARAAAQREA